QALAEGTQAVVRGVKRCGVKKPDHRHRLLRARRERPDGCRAAKQRDERAPLHSITSSASRRNGSGIVSPSAFAVFKLTARSNFVASSTGRSAGLVPCRILCTWPAARRNKSGSLAP